MIFIDEFFLIIWDSKPSVPGVYATFLTEELTFREGFILLLHIGIDDTDSPRGGCTTYIAVRLVERIVSLGGQFVDYPNLLRLNPNVPWKTRGNGAVCLRIEIDPSIKEEVKKVVVERVEAEADLEWGNTNPGIVFLEGDVSEDIRVFSEKVIGGVVSLDEALGLTDGERTSTIGYKNLRGIIGALAAIGGLQRGDYTFELLAYRKPESLGTPREVNSASVERMDKATSGLTFNNIDPETGRVLITPNGPDPVLFGVRGENPKTVREAGLMVSSEPFERWAIFRTNQGTDAHLSSPTEIKELRPNHPGVVLGRVEDSPRTIRGGHVFFGLGDGTKSIDCAAYEPTGRFRDIVRTLILGDLIRVYGGVRRDAPSKKLTLNLEKMEVLDLTEEIRLVNPSCPECNSRMESMGWGKGFRCRKCGFRDGEMSKIKLLVDRWVEPGLYMPPLRAQRHLTKPLSRYGLEKSGKYRHQMIDRWHWP